MPRIYLIRHGQASFGHVNYDALSSIGKKQSTFVKAHFSQDILPKIQWWRGEMNRHRETAEMAIGSDVENIHRGLNEFDHENVLSVAFPFFADPVKMGEYIMSQPNPKKAFQDGFEKALLRWIHEEPGDYTESYAQFLKRVSDTMEELKQSALENQVKEIGVFTSGGFIAAAMQSILQLPPEKMLEINWHIANASVTALQFNERGTSLKYFNNYSHLPESLLTWR